MSSELANRFTAYINDALPSDVQAPDGIELGNALLQAEADLRALRSEYQSMLAMARALYENAKSKAGGFTKEDGVFVVEYTLQALAETVESIDRTRPEIAAA